METEEDIIEEEVIINIVDMDMDMDIDIEEVEAEAEVIQEVIIRIIFIHVFYT